MLADLGLGDGNNLGTADGRIALDCSIRKTRQGHYSISTTDFFFPLVNSPYTQGRIGAANVLSDLYAEGVAECDFVLMLLAACRDMPEEERSICTKEMVRGFRDACTEAGTSVTGGQTVLNPWPIIGGVATSIVSEDEFIASDGAEVGNVVVLTKPLGTQVAVNVHQWRTQNNKYWKDILNKKVITVEQAEDMMHEAVCSMARLNRNGAKLMIKYGATSGTDVTGFGILGHAQNLCENQKAPVAIELDTLPCIAGTKAVNDEIFNFRLAGGYSAETSGGLMVTLPEANAEAFCKELKDLDGTPAWIIGRVVECPDRKAKIVENVKILEV
uniref:Selenide, water dikinase n=1 Tax=Entomoneis paludosa TaxID=265537 RepID=A0A7S2YE49_9STRA|mmetsp:Transcript_28674/g.59925  ORF Transcript_28674/g.59925 Transcript_28674/m.59925 type:complete len:329 (+) Transcript_28674:181-1167(+)